MLYNLARSLLFRLDPETAHEISLRALHLLCRGIIAHRLAAQAPAAPRTVMGIHFPNPVGLAAGLDKNGNHLETLGRLGFGFIELGTITPRPQPGNPRPRLFRLPKARALINRMGFNNLGVDHLIEAVRRSRYRGILGVNIGKNADTPLAHAAEDYLTCLAKVFPYADYVTVNISSPNTPGLRDLQYGDALERLLEKLKNEQARLGAEYARAVPLAVKIAPDLQEDDIALVVQTLLRQGIDAVIATNTTAARLGVEHLRYAAETGGLSGAPLTARATAVVQQIYALVGDRLPIIAVGGIMSGADAKTRFEAGASLVQLYTGLIYRGPALIREAVEAASAG